MLFKNSKYPNNNKVKREFLTSLTKLEREICLLVQIESPKYLWKCWKYKKSGYEMQDFDTFLRNLCFLRIQNIPKTTNTNVNLSQM